MPWGSDAIRLLSFKGMFGSSRIAAAPATLYVALARHDTDPANSLGVEPDSTGDYARVAVANEDTEWNYTANGGTNTNEIRYPQSTDLYSITDALNQWQIYDNNSGGTLIAFGELTATITVTGAGDQPVIPANDLTLSIGT